MTTDNNASGAGEESPTSSVPDAEAVYEPFGQLIKMLLPRVAAIGFYDGEGEPFWSSEGLASPDVHELVSSYLTASRTGAPPPPDADPDCMLFPLLGPADRKTVGVVALELPVGTSASMVAGLIRPVLAALEGRLALEQGVAATSPDADEPALAEVPTTTGATDLESVLGELVVRLGAVLGALVIPDRSIELSAGPEADACKEGVLSKTQKHVLAWMQLNNKAMVVNRIAAASADTGMPQLKMLSCPLRDADGSVAGLIGLFRKPDGEDFQDSEVHLLELAGRRMMAELDSGSDGLTHLPNRPSFLRLAQAGLDDLTPETPACLLYVDIDRLQHINDTFGFTAGDEVIQRCAQLMLDRAGDQAVVGHLGGDRLVALLPGVDLEQGESVAGAIKERVSALRYLSGDRSYPVTISVGVAGCEAGTTIAHGLAAAEVACKAAKDQGRDRVAAYESSDPSLLKRQSAMFIYANLQTALKENGFQLFAQPIFSLGTQREIQGLEILTRMDDGAGGLASPGKFMGPAERFHLQPAIDRWVLCNTLDHLQDFVAALNTGQLTIAINISGQSLASRIFHRFMLERLEQSDIRPEVLCFEFTERAVTQHPEEAQELLSALAERGHQIALDDFGSGLSSFTCLHELPVNSLKIDGALVREVTRNSVAESMVVAIEQAASVLGLGTVAEFVESGEIAAKLGQLGVKRGQGYFLGQPNPLADQLAVLRPPGVAEVAVAKSQQSEMERPPGALIN